MNNTLAELMVWCGKFSFCPLRSITTAADNDGWTMGDNLIVVLHQIIHTSKMKIQLICEHVHLIGADSKSNEKFHLLNLSIGWNTQLGFRNGHFVCSRQFQPRDKRDQYSIADA